MKELPSVSFPGAQSMTVEEFTLSTWVPGHETGQYFERSRTSTAADNGFSLEAQHRAPHNYQTNAINVAVAIIRKGYSRSLRPESNAIINILKVTLRKSCAISILGVTACLCLRRCVGANGISKQPLRLLRFLSLFGSVLRPPRFRRLRNLGSTCRRHRPLAIHFVATDERWASRRAMCH